MSKVCSRPFLPTKDNITSLPLVHDPFQTRIQLHEEIHSILPSPDSLLDHSKEGHTSHHRAEPPGIDRERQSRINSGRMYVLGRSRRWEETNHREDIKSSHRSDNQSGGSQKGLSQFSRPQMIYISADTPRRIHKFALFAYFRDFLAED